MKPRRDRWPTRKPILAWHFLPADRRLRYGDGRQVRPGRTYRAKGPLVMCKKGMHCCRRLLDALDYARGPIVCRVEADAERLEKNDKICARSRKVLWAFDATMILHEFACRCAEDALATTKNPGPRSVEAIKVKRGG